MSEILIKDKEIVVPGEVLAKGMDYLPAFGTYRDGENIIANRLGLVSVEGRAIKLIPLSGKYIPKRDDVVIGKVVDVLFSGWRIELNSPYTGMLGLKDATSDFIARGADLNSYYDFGDYIVTKISNVTKQKLVDLSMKGPGLRKLGPGRLLKVTPNKVPRIIGKKGSMVQLIKDATSARIIVGQNGLVWLSSEDPEKELIAVKTIEKIEAESHISGLTDRIKMFLEEQLPGSTQNFEPSEQAEGDLQ